MGKGYLGLAAGIKRAACGRCVVEDKCQEICVFVVSSAAAEIELGANVGLDCVRSVVVGVCTKKKSTNGSASGGHRVAAGNSHGCTRGRAHHSTRRTAR